MSHEAFRDQLTTLAASTARDPAGYLDGLSPIHDAWHRQGPRTYGFLLFHTRVVRSFKLIVAPAIDPPIEAFTAGDFNDFGVRSFDAAAFASADTLTELAAFSDALEGWHNTTHSAIGSATGTPMMDPRQNIFFRPFWQLHFFIDDRFLEVLHQYGNRAHPGQFVSDAAVASHIEARHHGWVPRI